MHALIQRTRYGRPLADGDLSNRQRRTKMSNMSAKDRITRTVIAAGLIYWALTPAGPTLAAGYTSMFMLATAIIGWCPFYSLVSFKSKKQ